MQHMQPHPLAKLIRFGQIWLDLSDIWVKFGQIWIDLCKIKILLPPKIRSPTAMPKCLLFLVSIPGTTGTNMSTENNKLRLLC